jgi:transcriptional regulator with XRE-family HTH domain
MPTEGRIRLARLAVDLTVAEMAEALGVSKGTYERIESGHRLARRGELIAIAHLTGQELDFFGASLEDGGPVLPLPLPAVNQGGGTE